MQPVTGSGVVTTGGAEASTSFGFKPEHLKYVKKILRDSIYSDKVLAVIREYSANAWDAHNMVGKGDVPIMVRIPTEDDPRLLIEDYGPGMSHEDVFGRFAFYGDSSKRETNNEVGMLGIGCKCGLCYSDTIVITSRHGGIKRVYVAKLTPDGDDSLDLLSTTPWDGETGMTIEVAVKPKDIAEFERKAKGLFKYFHPRPDINLELPPVPAIRNKLKHGLIFESGQYAETETSSGRWLAAMGCITYAVDLKQLVDSDGKSLVSQVFQYSNGILDFPVGAIQISSSRESLEYSERTKASLVQKFCDLLDEYTKYHLEAVERGDMSGWERRLKAQQLLRVGLTDKEIGDWAQHRFHLKPKTFVVSKPIDVLSNTRLVREIVPEDKDLRGYCTYDKVMLRPARVTELNTTSGSLVPVEPERYHTWEEIEAELQLILQENKLDGIPIINLGDLEWQPPYVPANRASKPKTPRVSGPKDVKHTKRMFRLVGTESGKGKKYSENWEVVDHAPNPQDVYVVICEFIPEGMGTSFYDLRVRDEEMARIFGVTLPEVYGYKSTTAKPVDPAKLIGIPYQTWRAKWHNSLVTEDVQYAREFFAWRNAPESYTHYHDELEVLSKELGEDHQVVHYFRMGQWARDLDLDDSYEWKKKLSALYSREIIKQDDPTDADNEKEEIYLKYPLLKDTNLKVIVKGEDGPYWREYIKCLDMSTKYAVPPQLEFNI